MSAGEPHSRLFGIKNRLRVERLETPEHFRIENACGFLVVKMGKVCGGYDNGVFPFERLGEGPDDWGIPAPSFQRLIELFPAIDRIISRICLSV